MAGGIAETVFYFLPALAIANGCHEFGHAASAYLLGDTTPKEQGRVTLNPLPHIDPAGLFLPFLLQLSGSPMLFGWGKPVLIRYSNLRHPIRDEAIIAISGPLMNIALCFLFAFLWKPIYEYHWYQTCFGFSITHPAFASFIQWADQFVKVSLNLNVGLFIFNMLPIPPLDGSKILFNFFGATGKGFYFRLEPFGFLILVAVLFTRFLDPLLLPIYLTIMNFFAKF